MASRYKILCQVVDEGSLKGAAEELGYTQSAVSQAVKALERELGTVLIERGKHGVTLTRDGEQYLPFLRRITAAEADLENKRREVAGLASADVRMATFTNVSRTVLPQVICGFKAEHPGVRLTLMQGDYARNAQWARDGAVDLCFTARGIAPDLESRPVYRDEMVALLPRGHRLAERDVVSLEELASEPFVLLDEGEVGILARTLEERGLEPPVADVVSDDYTIMAMVEQGIGVSALYRRTVEGVVADIEVRPLRDAPSRDVVVAWRSWDAMPLAARCFVDYLGERTGA